MTLLTFFLTMHPREGKSFDCCFYISKRKECREGWNSVQRTLFTQIWHLCQSGFNLERKQVYLAQQCRRMKVHTVYQKPSCSFHPLYCLQMVFSRVYTGVSDYALNQNKNRQEPNRGIYNYILKRTSKSSYQYSFPPFNGSTSF